MTPSAAITMRTRRLALGLTLEELGKRTGLGFSNLADLESGRRGLPLFRVRDVARALALDMLTLTELVLTDRLTAAGLDLRVHVTRPSTPGYRDGRRALTITIVTPTARVCAECEGIYYSEHHLRAEHVKRPFTWLRTSGWPQLEIPR